VRSNRVALIRGQHEPGTAFSRVDVEVVEPEVREDFLKLALAVDRTQELLFGQLQDELIRALHFRYGRRLPVFFCPFLRLHTPFATRPQDGNFEALRDVVSAQTKRGQAFKPTGYLLVCDEFGSKLLLDVALEPDFPDSCDVAFAWSERNPVQDVRDGPVVIRKRGCGRGGRMEEAGRRGN
jgi:hypothetical protein